VTITHERQAPGEGRHDADTHLGPWHEWLEAPGQDVPEGSPPVAWLDRLEVELPRHAAACHDDENRLIAQWQHMLPILTEFFPREIERVVASLLAAAARRGAADALVDMVRAERLRLTAQHADLPAPLPAEDAALRRLLHGVHDDRVATSRSVTGDMLEALCSIALDLEVTEKRAGSHDDDVRHSLEDLHAHVTQAAESLRLLPNNVEVRVAADDDVPTLASRCTARYANRLDVQLQWSGGEPFTTESAEALLFVLEEALSHLRNATAGSASVDVSVGPDMILTIWTPSPAFETSDDEPLWLLRSRMRVQLAGGWVEPTTGADGSSLVVRLPR